MCRIVEIAAVQAFDSVSLPGASFAAVVRAPDEILRTPGAQAAAAVHGICDDEISGSPPFPVVWGRFLEFVEGVLNNYVEDVSDGDEEGSMLGPPRPPESPPTILAAAHNGYSDVQKPREISVVIG